jgi:hypothetical protein
MKAVLSQFIPQLYRTRRGANPKETIDVHEQFGAYGAWLNPALGDAASFHPSLKGHPYT